jgi:hypothetical protein
MMNIDLGAPTDLVIGGALCIGHGMVHAFADSFKRITL